MRAKAPDASLLVDSPATPATDSRADGSRAEIARVEPLTTARALRGPFDYRLGAGWESVGVGTVLRIPFGPRKLLGVVVEVADSSDVDPGRLLTPIEVVGDGVPPELVELGLWVAEAYCSTPARGLGLVLAPGTGVGGERLRARTEVRVEITERGQGELREGARLGVRQRAALELLSSEGAEIAAARMRAAAGADSSTLRRLERRGLITSRRGLVAPPRGGSEGEAISRAPELSAEQREAVERLECGLDVHSGAPETILLHGVTGSGKTEVYLAAAETALRSGRGAIVLVPEIGLTPQAVARFRGRLGVGVAVLHSAQSERERFEEWSRLRRGEARVCVGPRSAVFAPIDDLGLIVIDEEHDSSYKQEQDPRYDARDVARRRMAGRGGTIVAGTATPRPESWVAMRRLELPSRVDGRPMPPVELVDMRTADPRGGPLHERSLAALARTLERGEKAIALINRRGFAPWLTCRSCGRHWGCPNCDVSLITHRQAGRLVCHHCGHSEPLPHACSECGSVTLARSGAGTEQVEEVLAKHFRPVPVIRLDADTAAAGGGHGAILDRFSAPGPAILVGTQMVAKGHDFHDVTLSLVVDADATLRFPDFRAEERTFALVTQLAGRSGRGEAGGRVVVQTMAPGASSIAHAADHDAAGFLEGELERRRALRYPPFAHLVKVGLAGPEVDPLDETAAELASRLAGELPAEARLLGPAPMFRTRGRHRRRLLVKAEERAPAVAAVRGVVEALGDESRLRGLVLAVDVDPQ